MNIPLSWLKQYVDINCDLKTFCDEITSIGTKVESVSHIGKDISGVVIGKVISLEKHPGADKLFITKIDIGKDEPIQIVTGADNLYEGAYVPVATSGAMLANNIKIKKGKLRGEVSDGMLCSIEELGFTINDFPEAPEDGIYIFDKNTEERLILGDDVKKELQIDETVIEFDLTSNRPDCNSVIGIAREVSAAFDTPLKYPNLIPCENADGDINELISVEILNPDLCPRYIAKVIKNVKIQPSPQWIRRRLTSAGIRPINNIVDITNYVMLELGQPMHAFDIDNIDDRKIIVRNAKDNEVFTTLDGEERKLDSSMLVISDKNKVCAIAGIMGGENSKVTGEASAILFESANFDGTNIRLSSKKLGLRTDSSGKYEKGLDPNLALEAVNRAAALVEELGCGEVVKGLVDCYPKKRDGWTVSYSPDKINALLGTDISSKEMEDYLRRLQIQAENGVAQIPTYRSDITCGADIAEEVARLYGYDNIPTTLAAGTPTVGYKTKKQKMEDLLKDTMAAQGFCEMLSYAFESPKVFDKLLIPQDSKLRNAVTISNPLGEDYSVMRTTTLNSILTSISTNYNRRNESAALFELAKAYIPKSLPLTELPDETPLLTFGLYGNTDFYDIKGVAEAVFERFGISDAEYAPEKTLPFMHPSRCARFTVNDKYAGYLGEIHPQTAANYEIGAKTYIAVIDLNVLFDNANLCAVYKPLQKFPSVKRDIAMLVKESVLVGEIERAIKNNGTKILESIKLFDVYKGANVPDGMKSVAYSLVFRASDRTLTDDEINTAMKKILAGIEEKTGAQLRDK